MEAKVEDTSCTASDLKEDLDKESCDVPTFVGTGSASTNRYASSRRCTLSHLSASFYGIRSTPCLWIDSCLYLFSSVVVIGMRLMVLVNLITRLTSW